MAFVQTAEAAVSQKQQVKLIKQSLSVFKCGFHKGNCNTMGTIIVQRSAEIVSNEDGIWGVVIAVVTTVAPVNNRLTDMKVVAVRAVEEDTRLIRLEVANVFRFLLKLLSHSNDVRSEVAGED